MNPNTTQTSDDLQVDDEYQLQYAASIGFITTPLRSVLIASVRRQLHPVGCGRWAWHLRAASPDGIGVGGGAGVPVRFGISTANSARLLVSRCWLNAVLHMSELEAPTSTDTTLP